MNAKSLKSYLLWLEPELHEKVKIASIRKNETMRDFIVQAMKEKLKQ